MIKQTISIQPPMKSHYSICVDLLDYIEDCHSAIPEGDREWIADRISRKFDCSALYEQIDEYIEMYCKDQGLPYGEPDDDNDPEDQPGPTYGVWIADPEAWTWVHDQTFTCSDDPDGRGARAAAHDYARYLRKTYPASLVAVRPAGMAPLAVVADRPFYRGY